MLDVAFFEMADLLGVLTDIHPLVPVEVLITDSEFWFPYNVGSFNLISLSLEEVVNPGVGHRSPVVMLIIITEEIARHIIEKIIIDT